MKKILILSALSILLFWSTMALAGGFTKDVSIRQQFLSNELTLQNSLSNKLSIKRDDNSDLREDLYQFKSKSPGKAFIYSLLIPGAGQLYVGSKVKAAGFFAADVGLWTGWLVYHNKGKNGEADYRVYADQHYNPNNFISWWWTFDPEDTIKVKYSHRMPGIPDHADSTAAPIRNREYYENIGKYDQFQMGWDGSQDSVPPWPGGGGRGYISPAREHYLEMRQQANKYFSDSKTFAIVSIGNHLLSAFEAAISAKRYNQGTKQYSLQFEARRYNDNMVPYLVMSKRF